MTFYIYIIRRIFYYIHYFIKYWTLIWLSTCSSVLETVSFIDRFETIFIWLSGVILGLFIMPEEPANIPKDCSNFTLSKFAIDKSKTSHKLSLICGDPGMMVQKIIVDWGGLKKSYIGPAAPVKTGVMSE